MSTVEELLDRADTLARQLGGTADPVIAVGHWRSFDAAAYRLLHALTAAAAGDDLVPDPASAWLRQLRDSYPNPLTAPTPGATYTAAQAAAHLGPSEVEVNVRIARGQIPATLTGRRRSIPADRLPSTTDTAPADAGNTTALARLSAALGAAADLLSPLYPHPPASTTPASRTGGDPVSVARVLDLIHRVTRVATDTDHAPDPERTRAIASWALRALDHLPTTRPAGTSARSPAATQRRPTAQSGRLGAALWQWQRHTRLELAQPIPSTDVIRNLTQQTIHLYAVQATLAAGDTPSARARRHTLRAAAEHLSRASRDWSSVSSLTRPSYDYVRTATTLHDVLNQVAAAATAGPDVRPLTRLATEHQLSSAATGSTELLRRAADLARRLSRSGSLFAPARRVPPSLERLAAANAGRWVRVTEVEAAALIDAAHRAARAAETTAALTTPTAAVQQRKAWPVQTWEAPQVASPVLQL